MNFKRQRIIFDGSAFEFACVDSKRTGLEIDF